MPETSLPLAPLARTRPTAPQPILDILSCARMNESAYKSPRDGGLPEVSGWTYEALIEFEDSGLALARFRADDGRLYLAVRGTHAARDVAQSLRLFFGQNPASRQEAFHRPRLAIPGQDDPQDSRRNPCHRPRLYLPARWALAHGRDLRP